MSFLKIQNLSVDYKLRKETVHAAKDINIEINGFYFLNYLAYWALRLGGWFAWNKHRKKQGD